MRRFFRFSVRDLFWLTLVVALALGWVAREQQLRTELHDASKWRLAAGGLEQVLKTLGFKVSWHFASSEVKVRDDAPPVMVIDGEEFPAGYVASIAEPSDKRD